MLHDLSVIYNEDNHGYQRQLPKLNLKVNPCTVGPLAQGPRLELPSRVLTSVTALPTNINPKGVIYNVHQTTSATNPLLLVGTEGKA